MNVVDVEVLAREGVAALHNARGPPNATACASTNRLDLAPPILPLFLRFQSRLGLSFESFHPLSKWDELVVPSRLAAYSAT